MSRKEILTHAVEGIRSGVVKMAAVELNGFYFDGADIAVQNDDNNPIVYRLVIIPHEREANQIQ